MIFHQNGCTIRDTDSRKLMASVGVSWSGKTYVFFIDPQKTKLDQNCYIDLLKTSLLAWISSTLSGEWLWIPAKQCSVTPRRSDNRPTTSVCKSTGPQRGNQKQMEGGHRWDSSEIHYTMKKRLNAVRKQNGGSIFSTFSANRCDWISISCSETCWNWRLFCTFWTPSSLLRISLSKQKRITS